MKSANKVQLKSEFVREHVRGDVRSDGLVFDAYAHRGDKVYERWCSPEKLKLRVAQSNAASLEWARRPENKQRQVEYAKTSNRKRRIATPEKFMLTAAKKRAKDKGLPFTICEADIAVPAVCPVLGMPIIVNGGGHNDNSPSLDRIVNELGYTPDNVRVISWRANRIKGNATPDELFKVWEYAKNQF